MEILDHLCAYWTNKLVLGKIFAFFLISKLDSISYYKNLILLPVSYIKGKSMKIHTIRAIFLKPLGHN